MIIVEWFVVREYKTKGKRTITTSQRRYIKQFGYAEIDKAKLFMQEKQSKGYHARIIGENQ